ncbi:MAG TPA: M15 family metallopeptidase [Bacillota bacterium]|nr:M15 family metallopeptidase [Bacillota bacterium]
MPAKDLSDLVPEFQTKVQTLIKNCQNRGIEMRINDTLRDPFGQAKLWRQSRSREEITAKIQEFKTAGADFLAYCIESVGPQFGDPVTNTPPGLSWHQWGEAFDAFWIVGGKAEWSTIKKVGGLNGFRVYAEEAKSLGLTAGGLWTNFKDWPHVQLRVAGTPKSIYTIKQINDKMKERFGR